MPARNCVPDLSSRRQSLAFATPGINRPRPSSVTAIAKPIHPETHLKKETSALCTSTSTAKENTQYIKTPIARSKTLVPV
jgi:hypothetical protein